MLRHKKSMHSDSEYDDMSDSDEQDDIFGSASDKEADAMSVTSSDDSLDYDPWQDIVDEAFNKCQAQFQVNVNKLTEKDGEISENEAEEIVFKDMKTKYRKAMMNAFGSKLVWFDVMKKDPIYKAIKKTVNQLISDEQYDPQEAVKYAILKRRFLFDKVLDTYVSPQLNNDIDDEQEFSE
jgi:hypothetical protein